VALRPVLPRRSDASLTSDDELAQIAREVPGGFAAYFLESPAEPRVLEKPQARQRAVVRLVRPAERATALAALGPRLAAFYGVDRLDLADARVRPARWDFAQLYDWYQYLNAQVVGIGELQMSDIDEADNRITYGVRSETGRRALLRRVQALGVPCGLVAVVLVQVEWE
jgi:hypothetical protein